MPLVLLGCRALLKLFANNSRVQKTKQTAMNESQFTRIVGTKLYRIQKTSFVAGLIAGGLLFLPIIYVHTWMLATVFAALGLSFVVGSASSAIAYFRFTRASHSALPLPPNTSPTPRHGKTGARKKLHR
jgi:hypothetical protein